jgi:hypothetical protein
MATKKATTTVKKKASPKKKISADDIRMRAQQIYHERVHKGQEGDELSDWLNAEKELKKSK